MTDEEAQDILYQLGTDLDALTVVMRWAISLAIANGVAEKLLTDSIREGYAQLGKDKPAS